MRFSGAVICLGSYLCACKVRCALYFVCVCVCLGFFVFCLFFCKSCAFLWEAEMRREGLAVQCLFSICLLSLGRQLLSQLLPESPWQHLPLWAGRKTMPNIRKKQNHCLHMSRDCPPLVCLLWPMIANLCKTIPVAKEEGALERNILVRAQYKRQALLLGEPSTATPSHQVTQWSYRSLQWPFSHTTHSIDKWTQSAALRLLAQVMAAILKKLTDNHRKIKNLKKINNHTPKIHPHYSFSQLWMSTLHLP